MKNGNKGFSIVEGILIIVIIAVIGFVVWKAFDMLAIADKTQNQAQTEQTDTTQTIEVNNASDLSKVEATLDSTDIEGTETTQLNTETNF